jgi:hypothetical protein
MKNKSSRNLQRNFAETMSQRTKLFQRYKFKSQKTSTTSYREQFAIAIIAKRILITRRTQNELFENQKKNH